MPETDPARPTGDDEPGPRLREVPSDEESRSAFTPTVPSAWPRLRRAFTRRPDAGHLAVGALVFLVGFAGALQLSGDEDDALANARRADLLQALDGLTLQGERLEEQVAELEQDRRELVDVGGSEEAALAQAEERLGQLSILGGVAPATGPGIDVSIIDPAGNVTAVTLLSAIHELRSAGAEAMQIGGSNNATVRVVASTYVLDRDGNVVVDDVELEPPYRLIAIGDSSSLAGAVNFVGGLADDVRSDRVGGDVIVTEHEQITVDAVRDPPEPRYASPSPEDD